MIGVYFEALMITKAVDVDGNRFEPFSPLVWHSTASPYGLFDMQAAALFIVNVYLFGLR